MSLSSVVSLTFMDLMKITVQDTLRELDGHDYSKNVLISSKEEVQLKSQENNPDLKGIVFLYKIIV